MEILATQYKGKETMQYNTQARAVENPSEGSTSGTGNSLGSSSFEPYPSTLLPGNIYHSSRSSVSSIASHLFSPKQSRLSEFSPITPPLHAKVAVNTVQNSRPQQERREGSSPPVTTSPIAPMQPSYISQLATYMAEMVVYLWFSPPKQGRTSSPFPKPSSSFSRFCQDILATTQLSQSVVVLALLFIWKLQTKHAIEPRAGSEFKLTTTALMLANKMLDDHTYTNKTWAEVSALPLQSLMEGEMEFLQGLDFSLHVSHTTFSAWLDLLEKPHPTRLSRSNSRKKLRLSTSIAPSAPTSPTHHPKSAGNPGLGFDFGSYFTTQQAQPASLQLPTPQIGILHTFSSPSMGSTAEYPQYPSTSTSMPMLLTSSSSRKRKVSGDIVDPRRPTSSYGAMEPYAASNTTGPISANLYDNQSVTSNFSFALPPPSNARSATMQQDFSTLTSSFTPSATGAISSSTGNLAYYALAAGQHRGGYLAYQPVMQQPTAATTQAPAQGMLPIPHGYAQPPSVRVYANLPKHAQPQPAYRFSQSLSPADVLRVPLQYSFAGQGPTPAPGLPTFNGSAHTAPIPQDIPRMSNSPVSEAGPSFARPGMPSTSLSTRNSYVLPIPHTQPAGPSSQMQSQCIGGTVLPQPSYSNNHYSSFSNNGLPGVMQWPMNGLASSANGHSTSNGPLIYRGHAQVTLNITPIYRTGGPTDAGSQLAYRARRSSLEQLQQ